MKTNVWINLKWLDFQLNWTTNDYKVGSIRVPYDRVWTPDIVLFNNADGNYEASYKPNVLVYGDIVEEKSASNILWIPPAIYKSSCTIDVKYFPFDEQQCEMRFGSWTFDAQQVRLKQEKPMVNLEDYLPSGTWDVIEVPGKEVDFVDANRMELVYTFKIRRKTLFYTVNLIIPTVLISFLSIFVFYLPTDEGEKMTLCISILLALVVFLLLVSKILPPTSMVIPLISKYLIFTLMMNIITILNTVIIINWNYRTPRTHNMPQWVRTVFIEFLPKVLFMKRPEPDKSDEYDKPGVYEDTADNNNAFYNSNHNEQETNVDNAKCHSALNRNHADTCSIKDEIQIPITKSNSIYNSFGEQSKIPLTITRQQQHRKLDEVVANLTSHTMQKRHVKRAPKARISLFSENPESGEEFAEDKVNSCLLKINNNTAAAVDIVAKSPSRTLTARSNYSTLDSRGTVVKRANLHERRKQFAANAYSRSLEAALNETATDEERNNNDRSFEFSPEIMEAADKVTYITNHIKSENYYEEACRN